MQCTHEEKEIKGLSNPTSNTNTLILFHPTQEQDGEEDVAFIYVIIIIYVYRNIK